MCKCVQLHKFNCGRWTHRDSWAEEVVEKDGYKIVRSINHIVYTLGWTLIEDPALPVHVCVCVCVHVCVCVCACVRMCVHVCVCLSTPYLYFVYIIYVPCSRGRHSFLKVSQQFFRISQHMCRQCVPGSLSTYEREPGVEARSGAWDYPKGGS